MTLSKKLRISFSLIVFVSIIGASCVPFISKLYRLPATKYWNVRVLAQNTFELSCPLGMTSVQGLQTFNTATGKYRQNYCVDVSGNVYENTALALTVGNGGLIQNVVNSLPGGTTGGGSIYIPCGTYVGPTAIPSSVSFLGVCAPHSIGITNAHVTFTYTAPLAIAGVTNIRMENITLDFSASSAPSTASLILQDSPEDYFLNLTLNQCGGTNGACLALIADLSSGFRTVKNDFYNLQMYANSATSGLNQGPAKSCILIQGTGPVNNGPSPTLNHFYDTWCRGFMVGGIDAEINSDTNYFWGFQQLYEGGSCPTNSYLLGWNLTTPASDQDADGSFYYGVNYTATCTPTSIIRAGSSFGNLVQFTPTGGNVPTVQLGGTVGFTLMTTPLNSNIADIQVSNGRLSACATASPCPVAGQNAGDISAWRTSTTGVIFLGNDAGNISRINSFDFAFIGAAGGGATMRTAAFTFATLPAAPNGAITWCSDCNATCAAGASTGRNCSRENGTWVGF